MQASEIVRLPDPRQNVRIGLREVVRDLRDTPHVLWRLRITGWQFPHRAGIPFVVVGDVVSAFVQIDPDGRGASAYFDRRLPGAERISFGYGNVVAWDFDVRLPGTPERLDRTRLPRAIKDPFA